jgi:hypothetical protein
MGSRWAQARTRYSQRIAPFKARGVVILDLDESGLIKCCTEYYDRSIMPMGVKAPYADDPRGLQ